MKKILTLFLSVMVAVMSCVMTVSADEDPRIISNEMLREKVKSYIEEHELPVLYTSEDMDESIPGRMVVVCEESEAFAVNDELKQYVMNNYSCEYPVFVVWSEEQVQLKDTLKAFIADRQICADVTIPSDFGYNKIFVHFPPESYDRTTGTWRGQSELLKYADTIHVGTHNNQSEEYNMEMIVTATDSKDDISYSMRGDVNNDGKTDALDSQLVLNNMLDLMLGNETEPLAGADIDGDGEVTSLDAQYILQFYLRNDVLEEMTMWRDILPA